MNSLGAFNVNYAISDYASQRSATSDANQAGSGAAALGTGTGAGNPAHAAYRNSLRGSGANFPPRSSSLATDKEGPGRTKRQGPTFSKCFEGDFRECRGGASLDSSAYSNEKFDQFENSKLRGENGQCDGLVREAIRRIDRNTDPAGDGSRTTLSTAVHGMAIDTSNVHADEMYNRIANFQSNPGALGLQSFGRTSTLTLPSHESRQDRIEDTVATLGSLSPGSVAIVGMSIVSAANMGRATNGHSIVIQRVQDTPARRGEFAIYDPNNGVFNYQNVDDMQQATRAYLRDAFNEGGMYASPDVIRTYIPSTDRDWSRTLPTTILPTATTSREPEFLIPRLPAYAGIQS